MNILKKILLINKKDKVNNITFLIKIIILLINVINRCIYCRRLSYEKIFII
jgi:hypothetical protein